MAAQYWERKKLERLCRYITRPAILEKRLSITPAGNIRYQLKKPYRDGTSHVVFEPMDFLAKLAALVPKPRVNLTRFHGVFAANSRFRSEVTPGRRGKPTDPLEKSPPGKASDEIQTLSNEISSVGNALGLSGDEDFRNANGVYMKLMNFQVILKALSCSKTNSPRYFEH